jgi:4-diphosphocytidyl-2C-methyl-D-erythritol kinase
MRLLGVPIGMSGSGPTLWALYPSLDEAETSAARVRDELRVGTLDSPGAGTPFVEATTIESGQGEVGPR